MIPLRAEAQRTLPSEIERPYLSVEHARSERGIQIEPTSPRQEPMRIPERATEISAGNQSVSHDRGRGASLGHAFFRTRQWAHVVVIVQLMFPVGL